MGNMLLFPESINNQVFNAYQFFPALLRYIIGIRDISKVAYSESIDLEMKMAHSDGYYFDSPDHKTIFG
jgi:hypothetical protein